MKTLRRFGVRAFALTLGVLSAAVGGLSLVGCAPGHGKYTSEHLVNARERLDGVKAGAEFQMAEQQFLAGDLDKAIRSVERSIALNPRVARSHTLRGRVLIELARHDSARESFQTALTIDPESHEAMYYEGILLERVSEYEEARGRYLAAWKLAPSNAQYAIASAEMLIELDRLDEAASFLRTLRNRFEHHAGVRQTLAHLALMRNATDEALSYYNEARLLAPDDMGLLEDLTRAQIMAGRFAEAEFSLSRLLDNEEMRSRRDLQRMRARCLLRLDRPVEARSILLALTATNEGASDTDSWIELGYACLTIGDIARVRAAANRVVAIAPGRAEGHTLQAAWRRAQGDFAGALPHAERALRAAPESPTAWMLRGVLLRELGRADEAAQSFAKALALDPDNVRAASLLAQAES